MRPHTGCLSLLFILFLGLLLAAEVSWPRQGTESVAAPELSRLESRIDALDRRLARKGGETGPSGLEGVRLQRRLEAERQHLAELGPELEAAGHGRRLAALERRLLLLGARARRAPGSVDGPATGISGTVTAAASGLPLVSVEVIAWTAGGSGFVDFTNSLGEFSFGLPAGTYFLTARTDGPFRHELYDDLPCPHLSCTFTDGTPVVVSAGALTSGIDFALEAAGAISGRVTDADTGLDLVDVRVRVWDAAGSFVADDFTDSSGIFRFGGLAAGTHFLTTLDEDLYRGELYDDIPCPGGGCDPTTGDPVAVSLGAVSTGIDFGLRQGDGITGRLLEEGSGTPVFGLVEARDSSGSFVDLAFTDLGGAYVLGLDPGSYFLTTNTFGAYQDELYDDLPCPRGRFCDVTAGTPVAVTATAGRSVTTDIDFELAVAGRIEGVVSEATTGDPVNTRLKTWDSSGNQVGEDFSSSLDGAYSAGGLATGSYFVTTEDSGILVGELYDDLPCPGGSCGPTAGDPVAVAAGASTPGIDFALAPGDGITGMVTEEAGGAPIPALTVRFWTPGGSFVDQTLSNSDGEYGQLLVPGTYFVTVRAFSGAYVDELYDDIPCIQGSCFPPDGTPVEVTAGRGPKATITGIDFELAEAGSIAGAVRDDATAAPLEGFQVNLYDSAGDFVDAELTDGSGAFLFAGLGAGSYFVRVFGQGLYMGELYDDLPCPNSSACIVTGGTPVVVAAGAAITGIDFGLDGSDGIAGTVVEEGSGALLENILLLAYDAQGAFVASANSDAAGAYGIGVAPGTYFVQAVSFGSHFDELYDGIPCSSGCVITSGTPITVSAGREPRAVTTGIDFELARAGQIAGRVTHAPTGDPFELKTLRVWDSAGGLVLSTSVFELYSVGPLATGTYFFTAEPANQLLAPLLYDALPCPSGVCDPTQGTPIEVTVGVVTGNIDLDLPWAAEVVFLDFFESGDLDAWERSSPPVE